MCLYGRYRIIMDCRSFFGGLVCFLCLNMEIYIYMGYSGIMCG